MTTVQEAIKTRCSTRSYKAQDLNEEQIKELVIAGLQAPTATNRQEVHISVMKTNSPTVNPFLKELDDDIAAARNLTNRAHNFWYNAPVLLMLSGEEAFGKWSVLDSGIAVENIALQAEAMGLGNVIIGMMKDVMLGKKKAYYNKAFGIPEGYEYTIAIAIGYQEQGKEPHTYDWDKNVTYVD